MKMTVQEAILARHSVRDYIDKPIPGDLRSAIDAEAAACNKKYGLSIQVKWDEPAAFAVGSAHYGRIRGVKNYAALIGGKGREEILGYCGEKIVLLAQTLGLNSCWVALNFDKATVRRICDISGGEKLFCTIALGYGSTQGAPRKSKPLNKLCSCDQIMPDWFKAGMEAAMLAPTAINQQAFHISLKDGRVSAKSKLGPYSRTDLGIVKYHFELGSGKGEAVWGDIS